MQAMRLNWPICRQGYEVLALRRSAVDWPALPAGRVFELPPTAVTPPPDATAAERRLLARWGIQLSPDPLPVPEPEDIVVRVIEPRSDRTRVVNVLAAAPDLFVEFANIDYSEARLVAFLDKHGPLYHAMPMEVWGCLARAARFQKVLSQFEHDKKTGSKRWLSSFERLRPIGIELGSGEINNGDLKLVPAMDSGEIQVWLEPPDLLRAIWLQFLMSAADDMTVTRCHSCRNFIAAAGSLGRSDKKFCTPACKQRDYRRRKAEKKASHSVAVGARRKENRRRSK